MADSSTRDGALQRGPDLIGATIGRYRVESFLGRGGAGDVYLANDPLLDRKVALKRIIHSGEEVAEERKRVLKEARRASRINDPGIAAVHDVLDLTSEVVLVLEYVDGQTLAEVIAKKPPLDRFWPIAEECARALAVAHGQGVLHRDIKPGNIMIPRSGGVKILDFGLARPLAGKRTADTLTTESLAEVRVQGTPPYMAPESLLGGDVDERTDVFSLGVTFYEFLTGKRPFSGPTMPALIQSILTQQPAPPSESNPEIPGSLSRLVLRMLAKYPGDRPATAEQVLQELREARGSAGAPERVGPEARPPSRWGRPQRGLGSKRLGGKGLGTRGLGGKGLGTRGLAAALVLAAFAVLAVAWKSGGLDAVRERFGWHRLPANPNVAVLPGRIEGAADEDLSAVSVGISSLLSAALTRLSRTPPLQLVSFMAVVQDEAEGPAQARELLGANLVIQPVLRREGQDLRETLRLTDARSARGLERRSTAAPRSAPMDLLKSAFTQAAAMLGVRVTDQDMKGLVLYGTEGAGTLQFYLEGLGRATDVERGGRPLVPADTTRIRKALTAFERAASIEVDHAPSLAGIARTCRQMYKATGDTTWLARGETAARKALSLDPGLADAHKRLAFLLWDRADREGASEEMKRASELDPMDEVALTNLAGFYGARGLAEARERVYLEASRAAPHHWVPYWWLATGSYYPHGQLEKARAALEQVIRLAPEFYGGYQSLGGIEVLSGEYQKAAGHLVKSIALHPNAEALGNLGVAYYNLRDFDRAVRTFNEVFQYKSAEYEDWLNLADAYQAIPERRDKARSAYSEAVRIGRGKLAKRPDDAMTLANLAQIFPKLGLGDSARVYLDRALSADPRNPMVLYCAALTFWQLGRRNEALDWMEKAVTGGYPVAWLRDSPLFDEWRSEERFRNMVGTSPDPRSP